MIPWQAEVTLSAFTPAYSGAGKLPYRRPPAYKAPCGSECTPEPALASERLDRLQPPPRRSLLFWMPFQYPPRS